MWRSTNLLRRAGAEAAAGRPPASAPLLSRGGGGVRGLASDMSLLSLSELGDNPGAKQAVRDNPRGMCAEGVKGELLDWVVD